MKTKQLYLGALIVVMSMVGVTHVHADSKGGDDGYKGVSANIGLKIGGEHEDGDDMNDDKGGEHKAGVYGSVTAVSGTTISVRDSRTNVIYSVDTTKAMIDKNRVAILVSGIAIGDMVLVEGTTTGTTVMATSIHDGVLAKRNGEWNDGKNKDEKNNQALFPQGNGQPIIGGTVTLINGTIVTITNKSNVTYTIDISTATVNKGGKIAQKTDIMVGDTILAQGTITGTSVVATAVVDQGVVTTPSGNNGNHRGFFRRIGDFFSRMFGSR